VAGVFLNRETPATIALSSIDADAAFAILRRISQNSNTRLVTVAANLIERHAQSH
jgi:hypothetical protein